MTEGLENLTWTPELVENVVHALIDAEFRPQRLKERERKYASDERILKAQLLVEIQKGFQGVHWSGEYLRWVHTSIPVGEVEVPIGELYAWLITNARRRTKPGSFVATVKELLKLLPLARKEFKHACDLGCRTGLLASSLTRTFPSIEHVTGFDINPFVVEQAQVRVPGEKYSFETTRLQGVDLTPFDLVTCVHVVHHLSRSEVQRLKSRLLQMHEGSVVAITYVRKPNAHFAPKREYLRDQLDAYFKIQMVSLANDQVELILAERNAKKVPKPPPEETARHPLLKSKALTRVTRALVNGILHGIVEGGQEMVEELVTGFHAHVAAVVPKDEDLPSRQLAAVLYHYLKGRSRNFSLSKVRQLTGVSSNSVYKTLDYLGLETPKPKKKKK